MSTDDVVHSVDNAGKTLRSLRKQHLQEQLASPLFD